MLLAAVIVSLLYTVSLTVEGISIRGSKFLIVNSFPSIPVLQTIPFGVAALKNQAKLLFPPSPKYN